MGPFFLKFTPKGSRKKFFASSAKFRAREERRLLDIAAIHFNTAASRRSRENKTWDDDEKAAEKKVRGFLSRLVKRRGGGPWREGASDRGATVSRFCLLI